MEQQDEPTSDPEESPQPQNADTTQQGDNVSVTANVKNQSGISNDENGQIASRKDQLLLPHLAHPANSVPAPNQRSPPSVTLPNSNHTRKQLTSENCPPLATQDNQLTPNVAEPPFSCRHCSFVPTNLEAGLLHERNCLYRPYPLISPHLGQLNNIQELDSLNNISIAITLLQLSAECLISINRYLTSALNQSPPMENLYAIDNLLYHYGREAAMEYENQNEPCQTQKVTKKASSSAAPKSGGRIPKKAKERAKVVTCPRCGGSFFSFREHTCMADYEGRNRRREPQVEAAGSDSMSTPFDLSMASSNANQMNHMTINPRVSNMMMMPPPNLNYLGPATLAARLKLREWLYMGSQQQDRSSIANQSQSSKQTQNAQKMPSQRARTTNHKGRNIDNKRPNEESSSCDWKNQPKYCKKRALKCPDGRQREPSASSVEDGSTAAANPTTSSSSGFGSAEASVRDEADATKTCQSRGGDESDSK